MCPQVPEVYAAGEKITRRRTLYCVGAYGIVARNGKVLVKGMVWGDDIIIRNEYLIESANAIALIVSEVLTLFRATSCLCFLQLYGLYATMLQFCMVAAD